MKPKIIDIDGKLVLVNDVEHEAKSGNIIVTEKELPTLRAIVVLLDSVGINHELVVKDEKLQSINFYD